MASDQWAHHGGVELSNNPRLTTTGARRPFVQVPDDLDDFAPMQDASEPLRAIAEGYDRVPSRLSRVVAHRQREPDDRRAVACRPKGRIRARAATQR